MELIVFRDGTTHRLSFHELRARADDGHKLHGMGSKFAKSLSAGGTSSLSCDKSPRGYWINLTDFDAKAVRDRVGLATPWTAQGDCIFLKTHTTNTHPSRLLGWHTHHQCVVWNILRDNGTSGHKGVPPNRYATN